MPYLALPDRPEVVGYNRTREDSDLRRDIEKAGGVILAERDLNVGTVMGGAAVELHYRMPDGSERYAYVVPHRLEIDAFGEESLICSAPLPDDIQIIGDTMLAARTAAA
jgi:hypothetical protein